MSSLLAPELFKTLVNARLPFSMTEPLDFQDIGQEQFKGKAPIPSELIEHVWLVLEAVSNLGLA
jgi:hypothetical protein